MLKKRPIILGSSGEFIRELKSVHESLILSEGQKLVYHTNHSGLGYRADKILEEIAASTGSARTFSASVATVLYLHIFWETAKTGSDENGVYVILGERKFYSNYLVTKSDGKPLLSNIQSTFQMQVSVGGIEFSINTLTLGYILYHNFVGFNPIQDNKIAMLRTLDSQVTPEEIVLVDGGIWRANVKSLMNSLNDRNLLIRGILSYYSLVQDEELGLSLDLAQLGVTEHVAK